MKRREVFLFVSRNMGSGYGNAYPTGGRFFLWWCERIVLPLAQAAFVRAVESRSAIRADEDGVRKIETVSRVAGRYVYSVRCVPDKRCTD